MKLLIINPFGIGDVLFTTPVIKAIKNKYSNSFIGFWSNLRVAPLLENNPKVSKVFALSRGDVKKIYQKSFFVGFGRSIMIAWLIKLEHFDVCLDFSLDHRYGLLAKLIGIKQRIGFNYKNRGRFLTHKIDIDGYSNKHAVEYYLELIKFLGIEAKDKSLELVVPAVVGKKAKDVLTGYAIKDSDLVIGIIPGAGGSWGKDAAYKHWPALRFAEVADKLVDAFKAKILILGDESESKIAELIINAMHNKPIDLTGKIDLDVLPAVIKNCKLVITNDGGPMHMAVALGIKSVSVFGPVSELVYGPYPSSKDHLVIKSDTACRPCYKNFRMLNCDRDKECLKSIGVNEVFDAAVRLLN